MKKLLSLLLILILCLSFLACDTELPDVQPGDGDDDDRVGSEVASNDSDKESDETEPEETEKDPERDPLAPPLANYGGYDFKIWNGSWEEYEIAAPTALNGQAINDAIYNRNKLVEKEYNVTITEHGKLSDGLEGSAMLNNAKTSGDYFTDLYSGDMSDMLSSLVNGGCFVNLFDGKTLDTTKDYWDQTHRKAFTIQEDLYTFTGDIQTNDELHTRVIAVNHSLFEELYPSDYLYDLVMRGKWTMETFFGYWQNVGIDKDNAGVLDAGDRLGFAYDDVTGSDVFTACGIRTFTLAGNVITLHVGEQKAGEIAGVMHAFTGSPNNFALGLVSDNTEYRALLKYADADAAFADGRILFRNDTLGNAMTYALDMEDEVYYVPYPTFNKNQTEYYNAMSKDVEVLAIHKNVGDVKRTGRITEALAFYSAKLTDQVVDLLIQDKLSEKVEPHELLRVALDAKAYELDFMGEIGFSEKLNTMLAKNTLNTYADTTSTWAQQAIKISGNGLVQMFIKRYVNADV